MMMLIEICIAGLNCRAGYATDHKWQGKKGSRLIVLYYTFSQAFCSYGFYLLNVYLKIQLFYPWQFIGDNKKNTNFES